MYGALTDHVRRCRLVRRPVYASMIGGAGAGKTYSALLMAQGIVAESGGRICLISSGENSSETLYSSVADFDHVDLGDPDVVEAAQRHFGRGAISWEGEGIDARVARFAVEQIAPGLGPDGVMIFDSISTVWDGTKCRVDIWSGGDPKKTGRAWQIVGAEHEQLWRRFDTAPCHRIICVRAKTEPEMIGAGKTRRAVRMPTRQILRGENAFRTDVRFWIDFEHMARVEGSLTALNDRPPVQITPAIGAEVARMQAPGEQTAEAGQ